MAVSSPEGAGREGPGKFLVKLQKTVITCHSGLIHAHALVKGPILSGSKYGQSRALSINGSVTLRACPTYISFFVHIKLVHSRLWLLQCADVAQNSHFDESQLDTLVCPLSKGKLK